MSLIRCNKFGLTNEQKELVFDIPREFYLFIDIFYSGNNINVEE
jgi:hypothetical protein